MNAELLDNKYQIEQLLGQGGMGAVYRATHLGTKRTVALKVIRPQLSAHDQFVARFRREAEATGRLRHRTSLTLPISGSRKLLPGRSLRDAGDQFETLDLPRSKWQARMKSRWTNT